MVTSHEILQQVRGHYSGHTAADDGHSSPDVRPFFVHADSVSSPSRPLR
jgi:hypothetical protein